MIGVEMLVDIHYLDRQGLNKSQIARRLGIDRKTVRKYLKQDVEDFIQKPRKYRSILDPYKHYLQFRLDQFPELDSVRLHREITTQRCNKLDSESLLPPIPFDGCERTVRRYVSAIRPKSYRVYQLIETLPGEQAQVDWGYVGHITIDGKRQRLYVFSFVLSYSRIRYVQFTIRQDTVTLLRFLQKALWYIGGIPVIILFDNAKTIVTQRIGSVIQFNQDLLRFAAQYRFRPDACWVNDPQSKGKVENSIKYVKNSFFYGYALTDLETLNHDALQWCDEVANEKVHGTTREVPSDRLADERQALLPLPSQRPPVFTQITRNARKDCTFIFETNQYQIPREIARKRITLNVHEDLLEAYSKNTLVQVHKRCMERGKLVLDESQVDDRPYEARRRKSLLQEKFETLGPVAPTYLKGLARSRQGNLQEQARKILKLTEIHGRDLVHAAMSRADNFNSYSYMTVKRIVEIQLVNPEALPDDPHLLLAETNYTGPIIEIQKRSIEDYVQAVEVAADESNT